MPNAFAERWLDQADGFMRVRDFAKAAPLVEQALRVEPKDLRALSFGAFIAALNGKKDTALKRIGEALEIGPDKPVVNYYAPHVFFNSGQRDRARDLWERMEQSRPRWVEAPWNLAMHYANEDDAETAERYFRKVMELAPHYPDLHLNLGTAVKNAGRIQEAITLFREGARLFPRDIRQFSDYLLALHYDPACGPAQIHAEQAAWGRAVEATIPAAPAHTNDRSPDRRLRIGYVSPDFRSHPVGFSLLPPFREHNHSQFQIYCYSSKRFQDDVTARFRQGADVWREVGGLTDEQLAAQISQDKIDVLVDLVMHTGGVRLGTFARKPAPVQVAWLAYPGSTGLTRMDYRFTDPVLDPPGETDHFYTEQSIRLESFWCFEPPANSPDVGSLPADKNGYITFGCLNNFAKVNDSVLAVWREILAAIPNSRLVLVPPKGKITERVRAKLGVSDSRLIGLPRESRLEYFKNYHRLDVALDPFPCTGGVTTFDSLWMGVPVVTLSGPTVVSRSSLSILSHVGLTELATKNKDDYIALAVALARDTSRLRKLRTGLRERLEHSALMDAKRFARQLESAYRTLWQKWCRAVPGA